MRNNRTAKSLDEVLTIGIKCIQQELETPERVKADIISTINDRYVDLSAISCVEEIPLPILELLYHQLGIAIESEDGKPIRAVVERKKPSITDTKVAS